MSRRAAIATAAAAAVAGSATLAFAAGLGVSAGTLAGAGAPVAECDASFAVAYTTSGGDVTETTIGDIADPACEGGTLSVTLADSSGARIAGGGPVAVPTDGDALPGSVAVPLSPQPAAESVASAHVVVVGP
jgi:hypothetical protein